MQVRDKTHPVTEWKGRWTEAAYRDCPCRPCYHPHDMGGFGMMCLTREWGKCEGKAVEAVHVYSPRGHVCKRCGKER